MGGKQSSARKRRVIKNTGDDVDSEDEKEPCGKLKVVIIGNSGVGKSALMRRFVEDAWCGDATMPTLGVDCASKWVELSSGRSVQLLLWDCAGQERFRAVMPGYYREANGAVVVYDLTDQGESLDAVRGWIDELRKRASTDVRFVVVGNKSDGFHSDSSLARRAESLCDALRDDGACGSFAVSARSGANVHEAFLALANAIGKPQPKSKPAVETQRLLVVKTKGSRCGI
jgi:small GTP-binding protein